MKINEIIVEAQLDEIGTLKAIGGALSGLSGGIAGAKGGWAAGKAAGMEQDLVKRTVQKAMTSWGQQQQRLKMAGQTPTVQDATAWFAQFSRQQPTSTPAGIGPGEITPWLQKEIAAYMVKKNSAQPAVPDEDKTADQQSDEPVDQQSDEPVDQTPTQPKPIEVGNQTKGGTSVVKPEPLTLRYKNQDYVRGGDRGEWTRFGSTKPLPQAEQAFLDSEEDELAGVPVTPFSQKAQPISAVIVGKVVTPSGIEVVKYSDGVWEIPSTDEKVVIPSDLKKLEELLAQQQQEPEPAVFTSNRPVK